MDETMDQKTVVIDPGHGAKDPGAIGPTGRRESDVALAVGLVTSTELIAMGMKVIMTRADDRFLSLSQRALIANNANADLFLSIHCNSAKNPAWGIETFIARKTRVSFPAAESIQDALTEAFPDTPDRGVKRANFTVLTETKMAAVLAELEFIHTPCGEEILADPINQHRYGEALALGVADYFGIESLPVKNDPPEPQACDAVDLANLVKRHATALLAGAEKFKSIS